MKWIVIVSAFGEIAVSLLLIRQHWILTNWPPNHVGNGIGNGMWALILGWVLLALLFLFSLLLYVRSERMKVEPQENEK